jgi:cytochrome b561
MKYGFLKTLGVILSFLWLAVMGQFALLGFFFAEEAPRDQWIELRLGYILLYIILGIGPVSGFILLMKKLHQPISQVALTVIGVVGATPIILSLAYLALAR